MASPGARKADQVFKQLTGEITRGGYAPDVYLPAERMLSTIFKVNRHVVREALKRLEQVGLVQVAQGGGTRVLDFRRHAGLDLLPLVAENQRSGVEALEFWFSVLEVRAAQARDIVRLCALRASAQLKQELVVLASELQAAESGSRSTA
jgi:GntR family transcriptional regulator, transcriptional repressor for pyruvate dehydrogenase complex